MQRIAFFDFDGTITTKDTLLELIKFQKGKAAFYIGFMINAPVLIAYKLKLISNQQAKQQMLRYFFKGVSVPAFQDKCDLFASTVLPGLIRPKALHEISMLLDKGSEVVLVTASAASWIKKWSDGLGIPLIATVLEEKEGNITGNISGNNCSGDEKVNRIRSMYMLSQYDEIYCYGDTGGDKAMLGLATKSFYKPFR